MTCAWEADTSCLGDSWNGLDAEVQERSLMLATSALQTLTYNRVGTCPITIRPCPEKRPCGCAWTPYHYDGFGGQHSGLGVFTAYDWNGRWYNDCAHGTRECKPLSEIDLPGPVGYVDAIKVDGVEIPLDGFRLDDGHILVWEGEGPSQIPETQDLNKPDSAPGTWSISYSRSYPVLADARIAVGLLAAEFAKACTPRSKCALPKGVTNVVRNGVSFSIEAGLFPGGLTGIELADVFILKWAPAGSPQRSATVFNPRNRAARISRSLPTASRSASTLDGGTI